MILQVSKVRTNNIQANQYFWNKMFPENMVYSFTMGKTVYLSEVNPKSCNEKFPYEVYRHEIAEHGKAFRTHKVLSLGKNPEAKEMNNQYVTVRKCLVGLAVSLSTEEEIERYTQAPHLPTVSGEIRRGAIALTKEERGILGLRDQYSLLKMEIVTNYSSAPFIRLSRLKSEEAYFLTSRKEVTTELGNQGLLNSVSVVRAHNFNVNFPVVFLRENHLRNGDIMNVVYKEDCIELYKPEQACQICASKIGSLEKISLASVCRKEIEE